MGDRPTSSSRARSALPSTSDRHPGVRLDEVENLLGTTVESTDAGGEVDTEQEATPRLPFVWPAASMPR
jgi:hypothetical protein